MKLIIDIPTDTYNKLMKHKEFYTNTTIFSAITNGTPVSTDGDLISREALKKAISELPNDNPSYYYTGYFLEREKVLDEIDNAPTVEVPENEVIK